MWRSPFFFVYQELKTGQFDPARLLNLDLFLSIATATLIVVISGSIYKIAILKSGGARIAGRETYPCRQQRFS